MSQEGGGGNGGGGMVAQKREGGQLNCFCELVGNTNKGREKAIP